jgi:hypothetical protein
MVQVNSWWGRTAGVAGLATLAFTFGCGGVQGAGQAQALTNQAGAPVVVSCEPNQRAVVRPAVSGAPSQVECVTTGQPAAFAPVAAAPVGTMYREPGTRVVTDRVVTDDVSLGDARVIPASYPATTARPVRTRQVVYDDQPVRVEKPGRSVKKSAIIVGSSAGIGAGIGAAVGGKKGALIGAAISGGGAAIWDQMTRRK